MTEIVLHDYQRKLKQDIYNSWNAGNRNVCAVLPTGGGKSIVLSDIALDGYRMNLKQTIIAHRNELVSQMSMHLANRQIYHKIIGPDTAITQITRAHRKEYGKSFINPSAPTSVAGVDTIMARSEELKDWANQQDLWTVDEFHHTLQINKWGKAVGMFRNARGLGATATPSRADGQGLGADYDGVAHDMVLGPTMRELIDMGHLSDYEIVCPESDLRMSEEDIGDSGDYSKEKLKKAAQKSHIVGDVVREYCRYALGKQAICFATDVETANEIARRFNEAGISAASLSAKTPAAVREKFINEFKAGTLMVLVNVDLFDEGFDVPKCEVVIMARPTASLGKYLQMIGRGLRTFPGKLYGLIIDHVSNVIRHGLPDKPRQWTLARRDKRGKQAKDPEEIELTVCKSCTKPYEKVLSFCPYCGAYPPMPEPRERSIAHVDGNLVLLDREKLAAMRAAMVLPSAGDVAEKVLGAAGPIAAKGQANRQIEKIAAHKRLSDAIAQWAAIQRFKGRSDEMTYKRFYLTSGIDVLSALGADRTRQEYEELAARVEGWCYAIS